MKNERWTEDLYLYRIKPAPPKMEDFQEYIALYFAESDVYIIALSSNKESAARINFDIAHELGHIMLMNGAKMKKFFHVKNSKRKKRKQTSLLRLFFCRKHRLSPKYHWIRKSWIFMFSLSAGGKSLLLLCFTEVVTLA